MKSGCFGKGRCTIFLSNYSWCNLSFSLREQEKNVFSTFLMPFSKLSPPNWGLRKSTHLSPGDGDHHTFAFSAVAWIAHVISNYNSFSQPTPPNHPKRHLLGRFHQNVSIFPLSQSLLWMVEISKVAFISKRTWWPLHGITFEIILSVPNCTTWPHCPGFSTTRALLLQAQLCRFLVSTMKS